MMLYTTKFTMTVEVFEVGNFVRLEKGTIVMHVDNSSQAFICLLPCGRLGHICNVDDVYHYLKAIS